MVCLYIAGKRKTHLTASELHISNWQGYWMKETMLLERGSETYDKWLGRLAVLIADNIKYCTIYDNATNLSGTNWFKTNFKIIINIDRGTQANVDSIRNFLTYRIKQNLKMKQNEAIFTNSSGITFNFSNLYLIVTQELFHIFIRIRNAKMTNYHHPDCSIIMSSFMDIVNSLKCQYDPQNSPDVLNSKLAPYTLFEKVPMLNDPLIFKHIKKYINLRWKLMKTTDKQLIAAIQTELRHIPIKDKQNINNTSKQIVASIILYCVQKLTPRYYHKFFSV